MNEVGTAMRRLSPTAGQMALAEAIAAETAKLGGEITRVPASVYTDPAHWSREKEEAKTQLLQQGLA